MASSSLWSAHLAQPTKVLHYISHVRFQMDTIRSFAMAAYALLVVSCLRRFRSGRQQPPGCCNVTSTFLHQMARALVPKQLLQWHVTAVNNEAAIQYLELCQLSAL